MIVFNNVTKYFPTRGGEKWIIRNLDLTIPRGRSIGLLGRNGAGKSTLLKMISGSLDPDEGRIDRYGRISFPLGFAGSFHPGLSGAQNVRFVARVYGVDTEQLVEYVQDFAELGPFLHEPMQNYSSGMRARLAFGVSMGIAFDYYLVDELTAVGDDNFKRKCRAVFDQRLQHSDVVMASHSTSTLRSYCQTGAVLENGQLTYYEDIEEAIEVHLRNMRGPGK
ncbi:ABC transporter ATP-binding protein [Paroceanicella profunda]|uniref:ABC transporter ATP-binding protein n=1 Tax=Paroceanicella profunda TaxID=2579971 RepID=A0A5B8FV60_9RHOB|nr:ABC transporter ATP-binding protein [Paroceanicella profunda]QDL91224.1 ABC transporter ATP-binding protein [Paroceanicella profunda]